MSDSKTLVVIGGSSGIGLRTAQVAAAQGARVIIGGRDRRRLNEALKTLPQNAIARQVDAFSSTSLTAFFDDLPVVDMLFTPGTNYTVTPFAQATEEQARSPFEGKFWPQYWAVHAALPKLAQDASVLLMSGAASARPVRAAPPTPPPTPPSRDWPGAGHRAGAAPRQRDRARHHRQRPVAGAPRRAARGRLRQYRASTLLQAVGQVDDVANAAWMLLSNRYTTGTTFFVDGGYVLR